MRALLVTALFAVATSAQAQSSCRSFEGQTIRPQSFADAARRFRIASKGEFESTAQFEARRAAAIGDPSIPLVIAKEPDDRQYFKYDADAQKLRIEQWVFKNKRMDTWSAFYEAKVDELLKPSTYNNLDIVISQSDSVTGTYAATNGYGAKVEVLRVARRTEAIFERSAELMELGIFPESALNQNVIGELALSPTEAQALKPKLQLAVVVVPKPPYLVSGVHSPGKVTRENPRDITESFTILVADMQCALLTDAMHKVLGSYATK